MTNRIAVSALQNIVNENCNPTKNASPTCFNRILQIVFDI